MKQSTQVMLLILLGIGFVSSSVKDVLETIALDSTIMPEYQISSLTCQIAQIT